MERSVGELKFINEYARSLLVEWARVCAQNGSLPLEQFSDERAEKNIYLAHALKKGWLTKKEPRRLTEGAWGLAANFLKR